jgi:putative ATP-dependent endonuclease of OLD family
MTLADDTERWANNDVRHQCACVVVGADRRLSYELSYTTKWTLLSKVMHSFHEALVADPDRVADLKEQFAQTKEIFGAVAPFALFADELQRQVEEMSSNLEYRLGIDFSAYDPSNFFHALRIFPHQGGEVRTLAELGTGQEQLLALAFAHAYARAFRRVGAEPAQGLLLVIEEPEAHLHPLAQQWLAHKLREASQEGIQVVITTHSPAFINVLDLNGLVLVKKIDDATTIVQLSPAELADYCRRKGGAATTTETVLPFYAAAATQELMAGMFARRIVLVEGPTEALALPTYLDRVGLNVMREGIAVIPVHGVGNLAKWWRFFTAYQLPVLVVFDNDARGEDDDGSRRADLLAALGVRGEQAQEVMESRDVTIANNFASFPRTFEATMRQLFGDEYPALEARAVEEFQLQSKPLVARYVAERINLHAESAAWDLYSRFAEAIRRVGPVA